MGNDAELYDLIAQTLRDMNPRTMTTEEVATVFKAMACFFERTGATIQESEAAIARALEPETTESVRARFNEMAREFLENQQGHNSESSPVE